MHVVALINCQRVGLTRGRTEYGCRRRAELVLGIILLCSPNVFPFCSTRLISEAQFVAVSVEQNVQRLSEGKLKVSLYLDL